MTRRTKLNTQLLRCRHLEMLSSAHRLSLLRKIVKEVEKRIAKAVLSKAS